MVELPGRFVRILARRYLKQGDGCETVREAGEALAAGFDSPTLCILAGLPEKEPLLNPFEVQAYLVRVFEELGFGVPELEECLRMYSLMVARRIAARTLGGMAGCRALQDIAAAAPSLWVPQWIWRLPEAIDRAYDGDGDVEEVEEQIVNSAAGLVAALEADGVRVSA